MQAHTHTHTHRMAHNTLTDLKASTYARQHTHTHKHRHPRELTRVLANVYAQTHTYTHTHIHTWTRENTHLKENHNGSEALSDHLTSAQHPSINRKTGSAPQGRKQHLENRLKWGVCVLCMCVRTCASVRVVLFHEAVYHLVCVHQRRFLGQGWMKLRVHFHFLIHFIQLYVGPQMCV